MIFIKSLKAFKRSVFGEFLNTRDCCVCVRQIIWCGISVNWCNLINFILPMPINTNYVRYIFLYTHLAIKPFLISIKSPNESYFLVMLQYSCRPSSYFTAFQSFFICALFLSVFSAAIIHVGVFVLQIDERLVSKSS